MGGRRRLALSAVLLLQAVGCTGSAPPPSGTALDADAGAVETLAGTVSYEARHPTETGASAQIEQRPARRVSVELLDARGALLGATQTDESGRFELAQAPGASTLVVWARVRSEGRDVAVTTDADGTQVHRLAIELASAPRPLEIVASDTAEGGPAGAFHILDTMLTGVSAMERWTGRTSPPIFVYWGRGLTRDWSYFRGERPAGSGRYAFELLGGQPGQQASTDTDEHDEAIMLHELGHLVMSLVSTESSIGGRHPPGVLVDPGLAWEEGRVSWFAVAALGDPRYQDTIGLEPGGHLRVDRDYSRVNPGPAGIGSEQTVGEVLWDLADGVGELLDDGDDDGVALGPEAVMRAMMDLGSTDGIYPCLTTFLEHLVRTGRTSEVALKAMLERSGQTASLLPAPGVEPWPLDLALPASVSGVIDGLSDPAPSGGPAQPATGYDATRAYRFHLTEPSVVEVALAIDGSGSTQDHTDLDVELRDIRARPLGESRGLTRRETIPPIQLAPGWYVVYVRDGGRGNRARYLLTATASPALLR
jgi:hypothetical protein